VSFGQIVKAGEPLHAAVTGAVLLQEIHHPTACLTLLPTTGGVALAFPRETSFTWEALIVASLANQAAAFRSVLAKVTVSEPRGEALGPQDLHAVSTIVAFLTVLPVALVVDGPALPALLERLSDRDELGDVLTYTVLSGLNFYTYNEFAFLALDKLSPVTHSVANVVKRVVITVFSTIVFDTPLTPQGSVGIGIALLGTLLYSLAKKSDGKGGKEH
jgi:solute carrier family 35, member E1